MEFPQATGIISYMKFQRNLPKSSREQAKIYENSDHQKSANDDEDEFMKKL
jgi:hypothetical protein